MEVRPALFEQIYQVILRISLDGWRERDFLKVNVKVKGLLISSWWPLFFTVDLGHRLATTSPVNYKRLSFVQEMTSSLQIAIRMLS